MRRLYNRRYHFHSQHHPSFIHTTQQSSLIKRSPSSILFSTSTTTPTTTDNNENTSDNGDDTKNTTITSNSYQYSPWYIESIENMNSKQGGINKSRFRQHVNPLARKFQMPTEIPKSWPQDGTYDDPTLPLHLDIGCGKGGYLIELAEQRIQLQNNHHHDNDDSNASKDEIRNYLGLEIRPSVVQYAKERISKRKINGVIDFVGCNANVDLDRILSLYTQQGNSNNNGDIKSGGGVISLVSIQFPDPHFKKQHQKRRVVTPQLVRTLAKFIHAENNGRLFIQSDVKDVLDDMRSTIRNVDGGIYFTDVISDVNEYMPENPTGVPTEREVSVLNQNLPVYRTVFHRSDVKYEEQY
jgi:tRNA (guanine-N7-)-methyltransferase